MSEEICTNEAAMKIQEKVLADDGLSDSAKLMFCRLNCYDSFRYGWLISDCRWTKEVWKSIYELEANGYVFFRCSKKSKDKSVGLVPLNCTMKPN